MSNEFLNVQVRPRHGDFSVLVSWTLRSSWPGAQFLVRRSPDGVNGWADVGRTTGGFLIDPDVVSDGKMAVFYYQVLVSQKKRMAVSPIVATFGEITRRDFGLARHLMELEYRQIRLFTPILIFKLNIYGPICPVCVDPDTEQMLGTTLCETCFGTATDGGYFRPGYPSHMRIVSESPVTIVDEPSGHGVTDPVKVKVRMVAFPLLTQDDLIVVPGSDARYLVETVEQSKLNGRIPIALDANLQLLRRVDVRYKLPLE